MAIHFKLQTPSNRVMVSSVKLSDFPRLYSSYLGQNQSTHALEQTGQNWVNNGFPNNQTIYTFYRGIISWAGRSGGLVHLTLTKYYNNNLQSHIASIIRNAGRNLNCTNPNITTAINQLICHGIKVSFASKILRMLSPKKCVAYDQYLALYFGQPMYKNIQQDINGFVSFSSDCEKIANYLNGIGPPNPKRPRGRWFPADVEASIHRPILDKIKLIKNTRI